MNLRAFGIGSRAQDSASSSSFNLLQLNMYGSSFYCRKKLDSAPLRSRCRKISCGDADGPGCRWRYVTFLVRKFFVVELWLLMNFDQMDDWSDLFIHSDLRCTRFAAIWCRSD